MAHSPSPTLAFLLILLAIICHASVGREIPNNADVKQPEFLKKDRSFLVPGIGRFILPKTKHGFNPFTYNPVTGSNGGGIAGGIGGGTSTGSRSQIPGADDTPIPNPGVEVPIPGTGGSSPPVGGR